MRIKHTPYLILVILVPLLGMSDLGAQDIRYSQYFTIMPAINPAATGAFAGDYRFLTDYRQSNSRVADPFTTIYASYDMGWGKHKKEGSQSFFATGLAFNQDKAGDGDLSLNQVDLSLAYNLKVGGRSFLTLGARAGYAMRGVNYSQFRWDSQYNHGDGSFNPSWQSGEEGLNNRANYIPISAGILWNFSNPDKFRFNLGVALNRLNQPNAAFDATLEEKLPMQTAVNFGAEWRIPNSYVSLMPLILYQGQKDYSETSIGTLMKIYMSFDSKMTHIKKSSAMYLGLFYRTSRDIIFTYKFDLRQGLALGLSYDMNMAPANSPSAKKASALEVTLTYGGFFYKKSNLPQKGSVEFF